MALADVIAQLSERADPATRSTRSRRGQNTTSFSLSIDAAVRCESENEVDEVFNSFTRAQAHTRAHTRAREGEIGGRTSSTPSTSSIAPPSTVILLRHCRCIDCRNLSRVGHDYFCSHYIGGTKVTWATGNRQCDPPPNAWHYCSHYNGPQISKDIWVWPRTPSPSVDSSRNVCARSNISTEAAQSYEDTQARRHVVDHQTGQGGQARPVIETADEEFVRMCQEVAAHNADGIKYPEHRLRTVPPPKTLF